MRPAGCNRYSTQFPRLIPKCRADHPRVTHPFATRVTQQAGHFPFDLHVLSTPPAFVLSQDQTLQTKTPPQRRQNSNQRNLTSSEKLTIKNTTPKARGAKNVVKTKNNKQK